MDKLKMQQFAAGVLYDFAAHLTTLDEPLILSGKHDCSPILDVLTKFMSDRRIPTNIDPMVKCWDKYIANMPDEPEKRRIKARPTLKIYIAGPISSTNIIDGLRNIHTGIAAAIRLIKKGYAVFCPHLDFQLILSDHSLTDNIDVHMFRGNSVAWVEVCDAMLVLPGWKKSVGTKIEIDIAESLGIPVYFDEEDLLRDAIPTQASAFIAKKMAVLQSEYPEDCPCDPAECSHYIEGGCEVDSMRTCKFAAKITGAGTIDDGHCAFAGAGRGDCEHFIGLPGHSIPGQHDGDDDTVDVYGKPNGWCWFCWQQHQIKELGSWLDKTTTELDEIRKELQNKTLTGDLIKALKKDGELYYAWQANIAMAFCDEVERSPSFVQYHDLHGIANRAAINFLNILCLDQREDDESIADKWEPTELTTAIRIEEKPLEINQIGQNHITVEEEDGRLEELIIGGKDDAI